MKQQEKNRENCGKIASVIGIFANTTLAITKILMGLFFGFVSVFADGLNNLTDCGSSIVSLISFKMSSKPADKEHPYGHERIEYISAMVVAFVILVIAFELAKESVLKIINPQVLEVSVVLIITLIVSIFIKTIMYCYYKSVAKKINSDILNATAIDSLSDCISTSMVLISIIIGYFLNINIDGYVGVAVAIFAIVRQYKEEEKAMEIVN